MLNVRITIKNIRLRLLIKWKGKNKSSLFIWKKIIRLWNKNEQLLKSNQSIAIKDIKFNLINITIIICINN